MGRRQGDTSHLVVTDVLFHFTGDLIAAERNHNGVVQLRQHFRESDIYDRSYDLYDFSCIVIHPITLPFYLLVEATISFISCVIDA